MPTETNPTASETLEPYSTLDNTSRPSWSVPSQWLLDGGARMRLVSSLFGSHGARTGARTARVTSAATTTAPPTASWLWANVLPNWRTPPGDVFFDTVSPPPAPPAEPDPGVHEAVRDVGDEVGDKGERGDDHEIAHHDRVVA